MALVHLALHNTTRCGLRRWDEYGHNQDPNIKVAEYHGTSDDPLVYRPTPTCPACLAADPELRQYLEAKRKRLERP